MKSWTRTLNLNDAHTVLALATPGLNQREWTEQCHLALPALSMPRRREIIRLLRDGFLEWDSENHILNSGFLAYYSGSAANDQLDLVRYQWALSHPLGLAFMERMFNAEAPLIPTHEVDQFVEAEIDSDSKESLRKTRTVLLGALEGIGVLSPDTTGPKNHLKMLKASPRPKTFAYLIARALHANGAPSMRLAEAIESSLPIRISGCSSEYAADALREASADGWLDVRGDDVLADWTR